MSWISANVEVFSVVAAFLSAVATGFAVWATYRAPVIAVKVAEALRRDGQEVGEQTRLRRVVFFTLMQERATVASPQSVQMLNAVDAVFHDVPQVREAWADLYHALGRLSEHPAGMIDEKHRELLRQMAISLGLGDGLKRDDFSRTYYPTALAEAAYLQQLKVASEMKTLEGQDQPSANTASVFARTTSPFPPKPDASKPVEPGSG